jgi:hypothetical protein
MLTCLVSALAWSCHTTEAPPVRTALFDLTGESRAVGVRAHWLLGDIAEHRQAISISGMLNVPDIGQEFNFDAKNDVSTVVGVSVVQSYRLIGEPVEDVDTSAAVAGAKMALERVQRLALKASILAADAGGIRAELRELLSPIAEENDRAALLHESRQDLIEFLKEELRAKQEERDSAEKLLDSAQEQLDNAANTPGVMVARWVTADTSGGEIEIPGVARGSRKSAEYRSGFVVLGSVRVVSAVFGEDFWWLLNNLRAHEKKHIDQIGISTHLVQARHVAYTSSLGVEQLRSLDVALAPLPPDSPDRARVSAYWSFLGQYSNRGNMPVIRWRREPFCCVCSIDLPGLAAPGDRALQEHFNLEGEDRLDSASFQGWRTVSATITYLKDLWIGFTWKGHAAKYAKEREMWSAPSCPFCKDAPNPAIVRNPECGSSAEGPGN